MKSLNRDVVVFLLVITLFSTSQAARCTSNNGGCHPNAICTTIGHPIFGRVSCKCKHGYAGDGFTCADIDECKAATSPCHANAACTNTGGSFTCTCNKGYTGDGKTKCDDVDECKATTPPCHAKATCTNTPAGSFTCKCNKGYTGDGKTKCDDINECDFKAPKNDCHKTLGVCINKPGGFDCLCKKGYNGNGKATCKDIDECATNNGGCHANAICTNLIGTFSCKCKDGYEGDEPKTSCTALLAPTLKSNAFTAVPVSSMVLLICVKNVNSQWDPTSYKFFDDNGEIRNGAAYNMLTFKATKADDDRKIWCQYFNTDTSNIDSNIITLKVNMSTVGTTRPTESKTTDDHKFVVAGFVGPMIVLIIGITVAIILWRRGKGADNKEGNSSGQPQTKGTPACNSDTGQEYINFAFDDEMNITRPNDYENIEVSRQRTVNQGPRATDESLNGDQEYAELGPASRSKYLDFRQIPV